MRPSECAGSGFESRWGHSSNSCAAVVSADRQQTGSKLAALLAAVALGAAGCGKTCVAYVGTVCVEKQGLYDVQRFRPIIEAALRHCGGTWEQLQGWSVDLSPGHIDCADANAMLVMGCSDFGSHTITIRATTCPEQTSLAVEVCNVVTHRDSDGDHDSYPLDLCEDPELWWASNGQQGCMSPYMRPCPWTYHY